MCMYLCISICMCVYVYVRAHAHVCTKHMQRRIRCMGICSVAAYALLFLCGVEGFRPVLVLCACVVYTRMKAMLNLGCVEI